MQKISQEALHQDKNIGINENFNHKNFDQRREFIKKYRNCANCTKLAITPTLNGTKLGQLCMQ